MEAVKQFVKDLTIEEIIKKCECSPYHFKFSQSNELFMLSFTEKSDLSIEVVRHMNGVIFDSNQNNKVIHYSFPKAYDNFNDDRFKDTYKMTKPQKYDIEISTEGTHVKVYYHNDEFKISTSRSIEASLSRWNSDISFLEMFKECCDFEEIDIQGLDKNYCYSFVIQHPKNRVSFEVLTPYASMLNYVDLNTNEVFKTTLGLRVEKTIEEIEEEVENHNYQNYIVYFDDNRVKISSESYLLLKSLVKNDTKVEKIYIRSIKKELTEIINEVFKNHHETFDYIDFRINEVVHTIHKNYMDTYVHKKTDLEINERYEKSLKKLHWIYRKCKTIITKDVVYSELLNLDEKTILWILEVKY